MSSQPLKTGLEGLTPIQVNPIHDRTRQTAPARRRRRRGRAAPNVFEPACLCADCQARRHWPTYYVGNGPATSSYEHPDPQAADPADRTFGRLKVGLSFECWLQDSAIYLEAYPSEGATGTTSSPSAAAIAAAELQGIRLAGEQLQRDRRDDRDTRKANALAKAGRDVTLTASERARRRRISSRLVGDRLVKVPDYLAGVDLVGMSPPPAPQDEAA